MSTTENQSYMTSRKTIFNYFNFVFSMEEKRPSETENEKLSDNIKRSGSDTEIKDLTDDDLGLEKDEDDAEEKKDDTQDQQENDDE